MKNKLNVRVITYLAMIISVTLVLSLMVIIPVPAANGIVTLLDAGVYFAGLLFGALGGGIVGGLTGLLIDLLSGYSIWAPFSLIIHGLQGYLFGFWIEKFGTKIKPLVIGLLLSNLVMVIGYALANEYLYGAGTGLLSIPSNIVQCLFGSAVIIIFKEKLLSIFKLRVQ